MKTTRKAGARRIRLAAGGLALALCAAPCTGLDPRKTLTQYTHQVWQAREGLPQNSILAMVQTRDGYLWLGTQEGLVRFDGVRFTVFERANTDGLSNNFVRALREDRSGALWIGTNGGGVSRLKEGVFRSFGRPEGLPSDEVNTIYDDQGGTLWVGTGAGLARFDGTRFSTASVPIDLQRKDVRALCEDGEGALWAGASDGSLYRLTPGGGSVERMRPLGTGLINVLYRDRGGALWIGTDGDGLARWNKGAVSRYAHREGLTSPKVLSIREDRAGCLWIGTDGGGIERFCGGRFASYSIREGLSNAFVSSLCEDREGSLWIGTHGGGLNRFSDGNFTRFGAAEGLAFEDHATYLESRDGSLWIGTWGGGLYRIRNGVITSYTEKNGLSYDEVSSLAEDGQGRIWVGTWGGGLNVLEKGRFRPVEFHPGSSRDKVSSLLLDGRGTLWVGTFGSGIGRLQAGVWTLLTSAQGLPSDQVRALLAAPDGTLWIGAETGLSALSDGVFRSWGPAENFHGGAVYALHRDPEGGLWMGTLGKGLVRLRDGKFRTFTTRDGLFDDVIFQILEDGTEHLWMSSNRGIFRVARRELDEVARHRRRTVLSRVFGTADGMGSSECNGGNQPAGLKARDGRLWFPTLKGSVVVDPQRLITNTVPPPVLIEEASVDRRRVDSALQETVLPPGPGALEFRYTALSFQTPERVRFRYRLEGFDRDWVDAGTRRVAFYTNTPPGPYRFRVTASNSDGIWNTQGTFVAFRLRPHLHQTPWFFALCAAAVVLLAGAVYRTRVRGLTRRRSELIRLVAERTRQLEEANHRMESANRMLRQLSSIDGLTGIANRRQLDEVLDLEWRRALRAVAPVSLLMIDIDHFKEFNDAHGHQRGDDFLKSVATLLQTSLHRPGDLVARYGGEEFVVVLPATDERGALACANRLREAVVGLKISHENPGPELSATISLGVATAIPREGSPVASLLAAADEALYRAKTNGRNRVRAAETTGLEALANLG